jgi:predicted MFS family arabinose efflux permease
VFCLLLVQRAMGLRLRQRCCTQSEAMVMNLNQMMVVVIFAQMGTTGAKLLLALFAIDLGASPLEVGITFAMFSILPAILAISAGRWVDKMGVRLPLLIGSAGVTLSIATVFLAPALWALYVCAALIGVFFMVYVVAGQSLVGSMGTTNDRTRNFSYYSLAVALAGVIGRAGTGVSIDLVGHRGTALLLAIGPLIALIIFWWLLPNRHRPAKATSERKARMMTFDLWKIPALRRALIAAAIVESGNELFVLFIPLYGSSLGLSATFIGVLLATFSAASFLVRIVLPRLVARFGEEGVLSCALGFAAVIGVLTISTQQPWLLLVLTAAFGLSLGCGMPLSMALTYARAPDGRAAEAIGMRQTVNKSIEVTVPIGFGALAALAGLAPLAIALGTVLAVGAVVIGRDARLRRQAPASDEPQEPAKKEP